MTQAPDDDWRGLDPTDWTDLRALGHRMIDDAIDQLAGLRDRPVWQQMPPQARAAFAGPMPARGIGAAAAYDAYRRDILPWQLGNGSPGFMGWVHGGGCAEGMLAELLAGALNANLGGRDHAPVELERQVIRWSAQMLGLPDTASGLLVTGTSIANLIAVLVARTRMLGPDVRRHGLGASRLCAYASAGAHSCVPRALDMAGLGSDALRPIATGGDHRIDLTALRARIAADRAAGDLPFLVVGTAGSVDTGAIDDLAALAALCRDQGLWFHVDAAFGAMLALSPTRRHLIAGIERADSIAFDFHKWANVPYDAGCILVSDAADQIATFAQDAAYLRREARGMAGGAPWPCDLGPDLSRGFRALKVWMTIQAHGAERLGEMVDHSCAMATLLADRVRAHPRLRLAAPVGLNVVCFALVCPQLDGSALDRLHAELVADVQQAGIAAPSTTVIDGRLVIRAALVNHRIASRDIAALVAEVLRTADLRGASSPVHPAAIG